MKIHERFPIFRCGDDIHWYVCRCGTTPTPGDPHFCTYKEAIEGRRRILNDLAPGGIPCPTEKKTP